MTERQALFIQGAGVLEYTSEDMRTLSAAFLGGRNFEDLEPDVGPVGRGHGVLDGASMQVLEDEDDMIIVTPGMASIRGTQDPVQGVYVCALAEPSPLQVSSKDGNDVRIDFVAVQVRDDAYDAFSQDDWRITIVEGSPGNGEPDVPHDTLVLARITVEPGGGPTVITQDDIEDLRPHARSTGGIVPVITRADWHNPQAFDTIWEIATDLMLMHDGNSWLNIGQNLDDSWEEFGTNNTRWENVTLGSGSSYGSYTRFGRTVIGASGFQLGSGGSVTGLIGGVLPVPARQSGAIRYPAMGRGAQSSISPVPLYGCMGQIWPANNPDLITGWGTAGALSWRATIPFTWTNGDFMRCFFMYQGAD